MTTRYEAELQEIEGRMRNPAKKIHQGEIAHVQEQRERERLRAQRTKELGPEITCQWLDGEPVYGKEATARVLIGGKSNAYTVEPHIYEQGANGSVPKPSPQLAKYGYDGLVEQWALWKWHIARGSEIDEHDRFILDCEPPKFVWLEAIQVEKPKRGRPKKETV